MLSVSATFLICSFLYCFTLNIIFFKKAHISSYENRIFGVMVVANLIGLVLELTCMLLLKEFNLINNLTLIINKLFLIYLLAFVFLFTLYVFVISNRVNSKNNNKYKLFKKFLLLLYVICVIAVIMLPLIFYVDDKEVYSSGLSVNFVYTVSFLLGLVWIILLFKNIKEIRSKKYLPLFIFIFGGLSVALIQKIFPGLTILTSIETFILLVMYFTIENPDIKVIGELNKNKNILEKNNEDRSNFLFRMTQEVRKPISNIDNLANMIDTKGEYVKLEDIVNAIKSNTRHISYVVNNVLDVSDIDIRKIKMMDTKYSARRLFEEINLFIKDKINLDVTYNYSISKELPKLLYGDYIKLKQAIMSILINSAENTKKGFIDLDVDVIIKYDMCRLIVTIEDSGCGMNIQEVNDILTLDKPLDETDEKKLEKMDVDLNITKKIINLIGGSIMIKSEVDKGTEFMVVVDQKIVENSEDNSKKFSLFNNTKRVLIVDDNLDLLQNEKIILEEHQINVVSTMYGEDAVDKIRTGDEFDLIFIDDEMVKQSGVATLQELSKLPNFNTPVVVMLEKNKEIIKKHYIEKGFVDYVLKSDLQNELNRIVDSYLK